MNRNANKSLKRKVNDYQDGEIDEGGRVSKEAKRDTSNLSSSPGFSMLALRRLVPEDWNPLPISSKQGEENRDCFEKTGDRTVDRGTLWSGKDVCQEPQGTSQLYIACSRSAKNLSSCDCETQTYYFVPNSHDARDEASKDKGLVRECCVIGCKYSSEKDSSVSYYGLPSSKAERLLWADILGLEFASAPEDEIQEICSKHFDASIGPQSSLPKVSHIPKSRTRKKRTCDMLIAEEAEKVKQSMATGRTKRTPKPNRNYDWAELMPLIKSETDDFEIETAMPKNPAKNASGPGRRRKQLLDYIKKERKGNERPLMEMHVNLDNEMEVSDFEADEYDIGNISLPSLPRAPPPKPKGRPHRIQDTCTQTESGLCSSRGPLREVKVQCNLTAEPFVTCSSCSSIDWRSLDEELSRIISVIDCEIINPILSRCLTNALSEHAKPSHAANVLKMIAGLPRDYFESRKDIHIVSGEDELEEVEIEKFIHQEEGPIVGIREITAKDWNKKAKTVRNVASKRDEDVLDDPDSFGLKEATDKDDDEFNPEYAAGEEEDDELENDDDDDDDEEDDWDIKKEDDSGASIQKKKKTRYKAKKGHQSLGRETEDQDKVENKAVDGNSSLVKGKTEMREEKLDRVVSVVSEEKPGKGIAQKLTDRKVNRKSGDDRWRRGIYRCPKCNKNFSTRLKMDRHHQHIHLGIAPWKGTHLCEECGKTFTQKVGLRVHRMYKHGDPKLFQCTICSFRSATKAKLKRHLMTHYDERIYSCEVCGMALKTQYTYRNHMSLHTNEGKYQCDICQKGFHHKQYYEDHRRSHFNIRNYQCDTCMTAFKTHKALRTHIRGVHLNDKRIKCHLCEARFMTNYNLRTHMKKHERAEQLRAKYSCDICMHRFHSEPGLDTHKRVTHSEFYQPVQIKVYSSKTEDISPIFSYVLKSKDELANDSKMNTAEVEHVVQEVEPHGIICDKISDSLGDSDSVFPIEAVEAVIEDSGEGLKEQISVVCVFPCNTCGSMFRSEDLLNFHRHSMHIA